MSEADLRKERFEGRMSERPACSCTPPRSPDDPWHAHDDGCPAKEWLREEWMRPKCACGGNCHERVRELTEALAAYRSALRSGEPETDQLRKLGVRAMADEPGKTWIEGTGWMVTLGDYRELQAEIERLREMYRITVGALPDQGPVSALMAERDRYKEALRQIGRAESELVSTDANTCMAAFIRVCGEARAALAEDEGEEAGRIIPELQEIESVFEQHPEGGATCEFGCGPDNGDQYVGGPGIGIVPACPVHGWVVPYLASEPVEPGAATPTAPGSEQHPEGEHGD